LSLFSLFHKIAVFFTSSEQSKISNDVFRDVVHVFYRGILYLLNTVLPHTLKCILIYTREKSMTFSAPICAYFTNEDLCMKIPAINVDSTKKSIYTLV